MAVAGWWEYCFIGFTAFLVIIRLLKRRWPFAATMLQLIETPTMGRSRKWTFPAIVCVAVCCIMYVAFQRQTQEYPVITEHNVAVYGPLSDGDWSMSSDESGAFAYRPCPEDGKATTDMLEKGVGYIANRAVWQERGTCKSLNGAGLNFYWRTANHEYRRISDARTARPFPFVP